MQQGELSMVCAGLSERDLKNFGRPLGGPGKILGGKWPPGTPPSSAPAGAQLGIARLQAPLRGNDKVIVHSPHLLRLISRSADRIGYITNFCSRVELLHELKNSSFWQTSIQAFHIVTEGKKEKLKFAGLLYITKNLKLSCALCAHSQFLCSFA